MKQKAIIRNKGKEFQYITQLPDKQFIRITIPYSVVNMSKKTKKIINLSSRIRPLFKKK